MTEQWRKGGYVIDFKVGQSFGEPQAMEETSHVRFPRLHAHLSTQPEREVHGEYEDDEEASPTGPDGNSQARRFCRLIGYRWIY
jgi:hypothetical protein